MITNNNLIYSESHGRYIITVKSDALNDILSKINVPCNCIGEVKGKSLILADMDISIEKLNDSYNGVIEQYMS